MEKIPEEKKFHKDIILNDTNYIAEVNLIQSSSSKSNERLINFKISKPYDPNYWENFFSLNELQSVKACWQNFDSIEDLAEFMIQSIESKEIFLN